MLLTIYEGIFAGAGSKILLGGGAIGASSSSFLSSRPPSNRGLLFLLGSADALSATT